MPTTRTEARLAKLEARRERRAERPPWEIEGREPGPCEGLMWALSHGWTLEQLIVASIGRWEAQLAAWRETRNGAEA